MAEYLIYSSFSFMMVLGCYSRSHGNNNIYFSLTSKKSFPHDQLKLRGYMGGPLYAYFETMFIEFKGGGGGKEEGGCGRGERASRLTFSFEPFKGN